MKKPRVRFTREAPQDRIRQLGEATLRCIRKKGIAGISVRLIAVEAGVTQGLITHHFGELQELVAYAFELMSDRILDEIVSAANAAGSNPESRLNAYIEASFSTEIFDRDVLATWVAFWALILHSPRMSASQKREYSLNVQTVEGLLTNLATHEGFVIGNPRHAAIAFTAIQDGLWLSWCLNPEAFSRDDGIAMCNNWIEGLRRGAYAGPGKSHDGHIG